MDGVRLRVADGNLQQVVGKLGGGTAVGHLEKVSSRLGLYSAEYVGRAAALVFTIAPRHLSRTHRLRRTNLLMQHHRFLIDTNHRFPCTQRFFVHRQDVLHAPDVLFIQFRHAPHFFPATASGRAFPPGPGSPPPPPPPPFPLSPPLPPPAA